MYNNQDRNKINLNPGIKKYIKDSHPVFSTKRQRRSSEWMRQSWQREGDPALRWWRLPVMKRSVAAGRSRRAVGDGVGSFFSSTSSVSLLNWVIRVLLWPMLPHRWNSGGEKNKKTTTTWQLWAGRGLSALCEFQQCIQVRLWKEVKKRVF